MRFYDAKIYVLLFISYLFEFGFGIHRKSGTTVEEMNMSTQDAHHFRWLFVRLYIFYQTCWCITVPKSVSFNECAELNWVESESISVPVCCALSTLCLYGYVCMCMCFCIFVRGYFHIQAKSKSMCIANAYVDSQLHIHSIEMNWIWV